MSESILPMEFNVVVKPDVAEEKTAGGIILPQQAIDADKLASDEGVIVAVSPLAFTYAEWPEGTRQPQVGDRVIYARYAGVLRKGRNGGEDHRILKDKDIMAVIEPASAAEPTTAVTYRLGEQFVALDRTETVRSSAAA